MKFKIIFVLAIAVIGESKEIDKSRRIAGGAEATAGLFPWHARVEPFNGIDRRLCGGALIKYNWILSAGQCINGAREIIIRLGVVNILQGGGTAFLIRNQAHIIVHENFNADLENSIFVNDIGLIFIEEATQNILGDRINTISLPTNPNLNVVDYFGIATGFGFSEDGEDALLSMQLRFVGMQIINRNTCIQQHGSSVVTNNHFCTLTDGGVSTCIGDEGAPLITYLNLNPVLVGIGSTPLQRCTLGFPAIFTDVLQYLDWINRWTSIIPYTS